MLFDEPLGESRFRARMFLASEPGDSTWPDTLVTASDSQYLVVWFGVVEGRWETIGLDLMPRLRTIVDSGEDAELEHISAWVDPLTEAYHAALSSGDVRPITQADVRSAPLRESARWRAEFRLGDAMESAPTLDWLAPERLSAHQVRMAEVLRDALLYRHAVACGVSATELIARSVGVSRARADQRIREARLVGVLAEAGSRALGPTSKETSLMIELGEASGHIPGKA